MKKILLTLLIILMFTNQTLAERQIILTEIRDLYGRIFFNHEEKDSQTGEPIYYPIVISFTAKAVGEEMTINVGDTIQIGQPQNLPATGKELYQLIKQKFGQVVADKIKNIYLEGISEDISQ